MKIFALFLTAFVPAVLANELHFAGCMIQLNDKGKYDVKEIIYPVNGTSAQEVSPMFRRLQACELYMGQYQDLLHNQKLEMNAMAAEVAAVSNPGVNVPS
jgi:hypothetical protein